MTENSLGVTEGDIRDTLDIARELIASGDIASKPSGAGLMCAVAQVNATNNVAKAIEKLAMALENRPFSAEATYIPPIPGITPRTSKTPGTSSAMDALITKGEKNE